VTLPWTLFEGPLTVFGLGVVLLAAAVATLWEYRRLFLSNPKGLMSAEVLVQIVTQCGGPGYMAAFLLAGALLSFACAAYSFVFNLSSFINARPL